MCCFGRASGWFSSESSLTSWFFKSLWISELIAPMESYCKKRETVKMGSYKRKVPSKKKLVFEILDYSFSTVRRKALQLGMGGAPCRMMLVEDEFSL